MMLMFMKCKCKCGSQTPGVLQTIEQKFTLLQCMEGEKVNFATHQLQEAAGHWWHDYRARLQPNEQLTWQQFREAFRGFFIHVGSMFIKATEFHSLVQGKMSVVEYTHQFNELAQYAPNEVATDEAKKVMYEHGLTPIMQEKLCNVPTPLSMRW